MEEPMTRTLKRRMPISDDINRMMSVALKRRVCKDENEYGHLKLRKKETSQNNKLTKNAVEEQLVVQCSSVTFENGPLELNLYKYTHRGMKYIWDQVTDTLSNIPEPDDSFYIIHHNRNNISDLCRQWLNLFDVSTKQVPLQDTGKGDLSARLVVCYFDEAFWKDQVSCQSIKDALKEYPPSCVIVVVENNVPWKKTVNVVKRLKKGIDRSQIVRPNDIKHIFFEKCYGILEQILSHFISSMTLKAQTRLISSHLQVLQRLGDNISKRSVPKIELSEACLRNLRNAKRNGIVGYSIDNGILHVFITEIPNRIKETEKSLQAIEKTYTGKVKKSILKHPFLRPHCSISSGSKLFRDSDDRNGTLGMFATMGEDNKIVALSSGHVLNNTMTAWVFQNKNRTRLGPCIWPIVDSENKATAHIADVSVITVEENMIRVVHLAKLNEKVYLYKDELSKLNFRKVFKYGATSSYTMGHVKRYQKMELFGTDVIMVEPDFGQDRFSLEGDSGAIVLTRYEDKLFAVGVVFGDNLQIENEHENGSVVVSLQKAIERFFKYGKRGEIKLDKF